MTARERAEASVEHANDVLNTLAGPTRSAEHAMAGALNVIAIVGIAATHALLDIADAVRETNRPEQP